MSAAPVRLAVLGDPLTYTRSPDLHRAALAALGLEGDSRAIRVTIERLGECLATLRGEGVRGCNLTMPLKQAALEHAGEVSEAAREARSVNTIGFEPGGTWGDTTDGPGFVAWLRDLGLEVTGLGVHLLAAGGAARSLAAALRDAGANVTASARDPVRAGEAWARWGRVVVWRSDAEDRCLAASAVVVNASPLDDPEAIVPLERVARGAVVLDLKYGAEPTPLVRRARARGFESHDGLGLLVHQARLSLERWLGTPVPIEALERAVEGRAR